MKERKEQTKGENIVFYLTPSDWLRERDVGSGLLFIEAISVRLVPVCVFNGSRNRETEKGSVRQV